MKSMSNVRKLFISHAKPSLNGSVVKLDQLTTEKERINKYSDTGNASNETQDEQGEV